VPAGADVRLSFDIEAKSEIVVSSDVVSAGSATFHGALEEFSLKAREKRHVSYRVHFFEAAHRTEARLWLRTADPAAFEVTNFAVQIL
jgi:hypothetical protein